MARILIDFVESDKKMIKTLQYFANPLISVLKSFKTHLYAVLKNAFNVSVAVTNAQQLLKMLSRSQHCSAVLNTNFK